MDRRTAAGAGVAGVAVVAAALVWGMYAPTPFEPVPWTSPPAAHFTPTGAVGGLEVVPVPDSYAPEDIAIDAKGRVYGGVKDGRILRWDTPDAAPVTVADTGGRPLGMHFDADGGLLVADAFRGVLRVPPDGPLEVVAQTCGGTPVAFADDLEVGPDGAIWFSDASARWGYAEWESDLFEGRGTGRLCAWLPTTGVAREMLGGLHFANGIAVDPAGRFVLVVETGRYRVTRLWLTGPRAGQSEPFIEGLPGFPDGISAGSDGLFWLTLASPRNAVVDGTAGMPALRRLLHRLPKAVQPGPARVTRVLGLDAEGAVLHDRFDETGATFATVTSVQEHDGWLYLGSLKEPAWARFPRP